MVLANALDLTANGIVEFNNSTGSFTGHTLTNGQLIIGSTGVSPSNASLTPSQGFSVANGAGSITLSNLRNVSKYVVASNAALGQYTTIASAIAAAALDSPTSSSQATIWIQPGVYTENLTMQDSINLRGISQGVIIVGASTYNSTAAISLQDITFISSGSNPIITVSGTGTLNISNCNFVHSSGTCISSASACTINVLSCFSRSATSGGTFFSITNATVNIFSCRIQNAAASHSIGGTASFLIIGCYFNGGGIQFNDFSISIVQGCFFTTFSNLSTFNLISANAIVNLNNSTIFCDASTTYFATGLGILIYCNITNGGTATVINPTINDQGTTNYCGNISFDGGVTTIDSNGQLIIGNASTGVPTISTLTAGDGVSITNGAGSITISSFGGSSTYTNVTHGQSPYTVLSTDVYISVDSSGGTVTILLPNPTTPGRKLVIKDRLGVSANVANAITVTTVGGIANIDSATSYLFGINYESIQVMQNSTSWEIF